MTARSYPAVLATDPAWLAERIELARGLYGPASPRVLGTVWWYSTSSVLVAPPLEGLVRGRPLDPSLDAITLQILDDGRLLEATSARAFDGDAVELGRAMGAAVEPVVTTLAEVCGARPQALWAIAADSIANRALWAGQAAGDVDRALALATAVGDGVGSRMPPPRYVHIGPNVVVRRASCCLIDRATGQQKCTSCPNQAPDVRERRIREALGLAS